MSVPFEDRPAPVVEVHSGPVGHPTSESRVVPMLSDQSLVLLAPGKHVYNDEGDHKVTADQIPPVKGANP